MQSKTLKFSTKILTTFLSVFFLFIGVISNVSAQNGDSPGENTRDSRYAEIQQAEIEKSLENCPDSIKEQYIQSKNSNVEGTFILGYDNGEAILLSCPNSNAAEKLIIRLFVFLTSIVGAVFAFAVGKSGVMMITAFENQEAFQAAAKSLITSILAVFGVFFAYIIIVFIMTGILGIGGSKSKYNIICQQRIVFSLTLDRPSLECGAPVAASTEGTTGGSEVEPGPFGR